MVDLIDKVEKAYDKNINVREECYTYWRANNPRFERLNDYENRIIFEGVMEKPEEKRKVMGFFAKRYVQRLAMTT